MTATRENSGSQSTPGRRAVGGNGTPVHVGWLAPKEAENDPVPVYACPICGAAIATPELHEAWHESMRWS